MTTEIEYRQRLEKFFDSPLRNVMHRNALCQHIAKEFAIGNIIHYEEALAQMVVQLDKDWSAMHRRHCELMMNAGIPTDFHAKEKP